MWAHQRRGSQLLLILVSCFLGWILCVYSDMDVCTCACLYVCMYVRMRLYIIYIHVCMYVRTYLWACVRMYSFFGVRMYIHMYKNTFLNFYIVCRTRFFSCIWFGTRNTCTVLTTKKELLFLRTKFANILPVKFTKFPLFRCVGSHYTAFPCVGCSQCGSHTDQYWDIKVHIT